MATISRIAHHHHFINGTLGSFMSGIADFFHTELFDRSNEVVIATYEKAVQHYKKRIQDLQEHHHPKYPFVTFDPALDFEPDERAGRFLWQYPQFSKKLAMETFEPLLYQDDNVKIAPVLNRYKGRCELIIWCGSVYEYLDYRVLSYQFFGGMDRPISPKNIEAYFILPDEVITHTVDNKFTGDSYQLDWTNTDVGITLVKNINKNKYVFPFVLRPQIKLIGVTDGSEKYGSDDLAEWRLSVEMEWECDIPTHLISETTNMPINNNSLSFELDVGCIYVEPTTETAPREILISITDQDTGDITRKNLIYEQTLSYILTADDVEDLENDEDVFIDLGISIQGKEYIKIYGIYGELKANYNWDLKNNKIIKLIGSTISNLSAGNNLAITVYTDDV